VVSNKSKKLFPPHQPFNPKKSTGADRPGGFLISRDIDRLAEAFLVASRALQVSPYALFRPVGGDIPRLTSGQTGHTIANSFAGMNGDATRALCTEIAYRNRVRSRMLLFVVGVRSKSCSHT
jgi:hypothetical protein